MPFLSKMFQPNGDESSGSFENQSDAGVAVDGDVDAGSEQSVGGTRTDTQVDQQSDASSDAEAGGEARSSRNDGDSTSGARTSSDAEGESGSQSRASTEASSDDGGSGGGRGQNLAGDTHADADVDVEATAANEMRGSWEDEDESGGWSQANDVALVTSNDALLASANAADGYDAIDAG